jgi:hypothetical protein
VERALGLRDVARELGLLGREALLQLYQLLLAPLELLRAQLDVRLESRLAGVERRLALIEVDQPLTDFLLVLGQTLLLALDALGLRVAVLLGVVDPCLAFGELALPLVESRLEQLEIASDLPLSFEPAE